MTAGICAVAVAIASAAEFGGAQHVRIGREGSPSPGLASVPAVVRASFISLHRPRRASDLLPANVLKDLRITLPAGTLPNESRLVVSTPTYDVWLVPGTRQECMLTWFPGTERPLHGWWAAVSDTDCTSPADADAVGIFDAGASSDAPSSPSAYATLFAGILPTAARRVTVTLRDGTTRTLTANSQGAVAQPFSVSDPVTAASVIGPGGTGRPIRSIANDQDHGASGFPSLSLPLAPGASAQRRWHGLRSALGNLTHLDGDRK